MKIPDSYQWSSYNYRALGINGQLLDIDPWFSGLGTTTDECRLIYVKFIKESIEENELCQLRKITQNGGIFADQQFKEYINKNYQEGIIAKPPGRPKGRIQSYTNLPAEQKNIINRSDPNYD